MGKKARRRLFFTIILVIIVGYSLLTWVLPTFIGGLTFFDRFKAKPQVSTTSLENASIAPPVLQIPYEATNSALIKIKGYASPNTSVEIYLDDDLKTTVKTSDNGDFLSDDIPLVLGTNNIYGKTVDSENHKSLASKTITLQYINEKPKLDIKSPEDNQTLKDKKITVSGSVDPATGVSVTVNGTTVIVDASGNFSHTLELSDGDNNLTIMATDTAGNVTQVSKKVTYQP